MNELLKPYDIVEIYKNATKDVVKYVHNNGSETTLKTVNTCIGNYSDVGINKNKAVLFISVSSGCSQKCKFCYLTNKKFPFCQLDTNTIIKSCIEVLKKSTEQLEGKYLKISFMGMGDAFASRTDMNEIVKKVFLFAYYKDMIKGIDGVDIGTSYPNVDNSGIYESINELKETIFQLNIPFNPFYNYNKIAMEYPDSRTPVRLFISLHSINDSVRSYLMPNSSSIQRILDDLENVDIDVVFHYIMFDGINDSQEDIKNILAFFDRDNMRKYELRILRYNMDMNTAGLAESPMVNEAINTLKQSKLKFKYQISAGSEISASCGQFLCRRFTDRKESILC